MAKEIAYKVTVDTSQSTEQTEALTASIEELAKSVSDMSEQMKSGFKAGEQAAKKTDSGFKSLIKSLGLIGVALAVFEFMRDIISKNQKVMDALNTATTALEIIVLKLFKAVEPLGDVMKAAFEDPLQSLKNIKDFIVERLMVSIKGFGDQFIALGGIIESALDFDWEGVKEGAEDFGEALVQTFTATTKAERQEIVEDLKDFVVEVKEATVASVDFASALVDQRNKVKLLEAEQRGLILTYQNEAEIQRQIRDDISATLADRIAANEKLGEIQREQLEEETKIANERIKLAEMELAKDKDNIDAQVALKDAKTELADVEERINGQRSEQLTNQKALEQELFDFRNELRLAELEGREKEIEELQQHYDNLAEIARLAGEDRFEVEAQRAQALNDLNQKFYEEDKQNAKKAAKEKADAEEKINQAKITSATQTAGALGTIAQAVENQGKAGLVASKVLAGAQIAIDTATAISGAISAANKGLTFPANIAAIATGIASVLTNVAKATQLLGSVNVGGGGGNVPIPSAAAATASAVAPQVTPVTTNTTELGNTEQAELQPIQAFVVETQLTGTQNEVGQIEGQAEFG